jgi:molybdopterin-guanine dinucleotide biosynthesis protein A
MGRDKALLPFAGSTLAEFVARTVASVTSQVVLVGEPNRYHVLGYTVISDRFPGEGPLGGILTALDHTQSDWNLIVACDLPGISGKFLSRILEAAEKSTNDVLLPTGPGGRPEPLCAAYHRRALSALESAFAAGERKITRALQSVRTARLAIPELAPFQNVNTPEDWARHAVE